MGKIQRTKKVAVYTREDLRRVYERIVRYSQQCYRKEEIENCLKCIDAAALLQYNLNDRYTDERLNDLIRTISHSAFEQRLVDADARTVCFIDSFARDNHGLTQQYLDALMFQKSYQLIYISETKTIGAKILDMLKKGNAEIVVADDNNALRRAKTIYNAVLLANPSLVFFHLTPNTTAPFIASESLYGTKKIQVNLTDHAFWLGGSCFFDKSLEFRDYGMRVSMEKRGFSEKQLVYMPYYPWTEDIPFGGFPVDTKGKVVMFSGGAMYKTEGGGDKYFIILKQIMDKHPNLIFVYAGDGNRSHFESFIKENGYEGRMFLLGQREDINEVFKYSDIYYSTYPLFGGLMSQYAAINGKPILAYENEEIESVVCTKKQAHFTFYNDNDLIRETERLVEDSEYRKKRGEFFRSLCIDQNEFRERMKKWMDRGETPALNNESKAIEYDAFCEQYVHRINNGSQGLGIELMLLRRCPRALSWKMWMNILLNLPEVIRVQKHRKSIN